MNDANTASATIAERRGLDRREWLSIGVLTLVGAAFRFFRLGFHSLWGDELSTWMVTSITPFSEMIKYYMATEGSPPVYVLLQYPFAQLLTQDEFGVRFLVALVGTACVPAIYFLARQLFGSRTAFVASSCMATSYLAIYFSQEARAHIVMMFLCIVSSYFWVRICLSNARRSDLIGYVVSAVLLMYTHYFGLLFAIGQCLLALCYVRNIGWSRLLAVALSIAVLYAPWVPQFLSDSQPRKFWMSAPEWIDIFAYHKYLFERSSVLAILGTLIIFISLVSKIRPQWPSIRQSFLAIEREIVLALFGIIPFAMAFWRSRAAEPILHNRYMIIALPGVIVLTASAVDHVSQIFRQENIRRTFFRFAFAVLIVINLHTLFVRIEYYTQPQKDLNREASQKVIELKAKLGCPVVAIGKNRPIIGYYFNLLTKNFEFLDIPYPSADSAQTAVERVTKAPTLIYFSYSIGGIDESDLIRQFDHYEVIEKYFYARSDHILVLKRKPQP